MTVKLLMKCPTCDNAMSLHRGIIINARLEVSSRLVTMADALRHAKGPEVIAALRERIERDNTLLVQIAALEQECTP